MVPVRFEGGQGKEQMWGCSPQSPVATCQSVSVVVVLFVLFLSLSVITINDLLSV